MMRRRLEGTGKEMRENSQVGLMQEQSQLVGSKRCMKTSNCRRCLVSVHGRLAQQNFWMQGLGASACGAAAETISPGEQAHKSSIRPRGSYVVLNGQNIVQRLVNHKRDCGAAVVLRRILQATHLQLRDRHILMARLSFRDSSPRCLPDPPLIPHALLQVLVTCSF